MLYIYSAVGKAFNLHNLQTADSRRSRIRAVGRVGDENLGAATVP